MNEKRFDFGSNWKRFLSSVNEERISAAEESLRAMLGDIDFKGKTFLDVGCGSGLFSLAAKRMGALVVSFDYDPQCVSCAQELKRQYFPSSPDWVVKQGSALDEPFLESLGTFDIVYSWGVLHHTGNLKKAIEIISHRVKSGGSLFISIYNDQGWKSKGWLLEKRIFNALPRSLSWLLVIFIAGLFELRWGLARFIKRSPAHEKERGMSKWYDWVDWCGGLPFEVAKPSDITNLLVAKGFRLEGMKTISGWGCNEYVFRKI